MVGYRLILEASQSRKKPMEMRSKANTPMQNHGP